jgi:hypothetical protein
MTDSENIFAPLIIFRPPFPGKTLYCTTETTNRRKNQSQGVRILLCGVV